MQAIVPSLWVDTEAEEAARFYCSIFPNSRITRVSHYGDAGPRPEGMVLAVDFELDGKPFNAINGGPEFHFSEATSLLVPCDSQEEIDALWDALVAAGEPGPCGWLKDRYGFSWQIVPKALAEMITDPDAMKAQRVIAAMLQMGKIDLPKLQEAYEQTPSGA